MTPARILIVDDEAHLAEGIRENLEAEGYQTEVAHDGRAGLERIRAQSFDLVLLASHRARMISSGSQITVDRDNDKNPVVSLREIAETTVSPGDLKEDLIHSLQKYVEVDEPEPEVPLIGAGSGAGVDSDDTEVTADRMTEEELLKGLEGLAPPEEVPEDDGE